MQRVLKVTQDGVSGEVTIEQDEYIIPYKCPKLVISAPQGENPVDYDAVISESWITQDKNCLLYTSRAVAFGTHSHV